MPPKGWAGEASVTDTGDTRSTLKRIRTFVLGAGFSAGAGIPMTDTLLKQALAMMQIEAPGLFARIEGHAQVCFENDLPLLSQTFDAPAFIRLSSYLHYLEMSEHGGGERWSGAGSREILTFKFFLSKKLIQLTPGPLPQVYIDFARQLDCYDTVLTFNWDCLLEKAIVAAGKRYTYNPFDADWVDPERANVIRIMKMHGSANWTLPSNSTVDSDLYTQVPFSPNFELEPIHHSDKLLELEQWQGCNWLSGHAQPLVQPFIILPGIGKAYDVRKIASFWDRPAGHFYSSRDVYIVGLSLSDDDFFLRFLFLQSFPQGDWEGIERSVTVINPDADAMRNYRFLGERNVVLRQKCFDAEDVEFMIGRRDR
jgi:hypothetical protein